MITLPAARLLICLVLGNLWFDGSQGDLSFPTDLRTDRYQFPPVVPKSTNPNIPIGHLRPLGFQRRPDGKVKEYSEVLSPAEFWNDHVSKNRPLKFKEAVTSSPAFNKWTDDTYLNNEFGDLDILVERKIEDRSTSPKRMLFSSFLDNYNSHNWYVVTVLPDPMRPDVQVPRCLLCGSFRDSLMESNLWMSSGGTASVLHYDADHNIHCLITGRKDFIMIDPKYEKHLYMVEKMNITGSGFSEMDIDMINMFKYPEIAKVGWTWATLYPGDCIYIPAGYLHQVRSYGRSVAHTLLFVNNGTFSNSGCQNNPLDYTSLDQVQLVWTYKKGDKVIDMGYMNPEILRKALLLWAEEKGRITRDVFAEFYDRETSHFLGDNSVPDSDQVFQLLDKENNGYLTHQDVINIEMDLLKMLARIIDLPHGPEIHDEL